MPFFFDLSSLVPIVERNPFEPVVVPDVVTASPLGEAEELTPEEITEAPEAVAATVKESVEEPVADFGLPVPAHYDFDMMRALCQDPFRLFVYWQLKDNPFDRLRKIFPNGEVANFHTVLKLIDETNNIAVFFNAAYANEYWFSVFPDRSYRVELGLRSHRYGFIKLLSSQTARTPRGGPSDQAAPEEEYRIGADDYLDVLRDGHLVPQRAFTIEEILPGAGVVPAAARNAVWESLPLSFRRLAAAIADIQAGRDYDHWWERLNQEELSDLVREFLATIAEMGDGELGYMLLLRYLPELLRRSVQAEAEASGQLQIDKPITLYLAERLGQAASEMNFVPQAEQPHRPGQAVPPPAAGEHQERWLPSMSS